MTKRPKGFRSRRRAIERALWFSTPLGLVVPACSASEEPARGQLMIALQSDMAVPGDFNRIRLQVLVRGDLRHDGTYTVAPDGTTKLPATLAVVAGAEKNPPVEVRVIGIRGTDAQTFSKVITTVPSNRIATLHVPMQWMCKGEVVQQGVGDDAVYESSCAPSSDQTERSCVVGRCTNVFVEESDLPDFEPTKVFGGGRRPGDPSGECFDVQACFRSGMDVTAELDNDCRLDLDVPDGYQASFAIRVPPGEGICDDDDDSAPCFVPLDKDERYGWREIDRSARAQIPAAICDRLAGEPDLALFATFACDEKTNELPTCGEWSSSPTAGVANPPDPRGGTSGTGNTAGGEGGGGGSAAIGTGGSPPTGDTRSNAQWENELRATIEMQHADNGCPGVPETNPFASSAAATLADLALSDPDALTGSDLPFSLITEAGIPGAAFWYGSTTDTLTPLPENVFAEFYASSPCNPSSLGVAVSGPPGQTRGYAIVLAGCTDCNTSCLPQCDGSAGAGGSSGSGAGGTTAGGAPPSGGQSAGGAGAVGGSGVGGSMVSPVCQDPIMANGPCQSQGATCSDMPCGLADAGRRECTCSEIWNCTACDFTGTPYEFPPEDAGTCTTEADGVPCSALGDICIDAPNGEVCACYEDMRGDDVWDCDQQPWP